MKAKEYAEKYFANPTDNTLKEIFCGLLVEIKTIAKQRRVQRTSAFVSILNEVDDKWRAFIRIIGDRINPDGFELLVKELYPDVYHLWKR